MGKINEYHEFLRAADYYESRSVGTRARSDKRCEHCGEMIPKGTPHLTHHFYPEFESYPTHTECDFAFRSSLIPESVAETSRFSKEDQEFIDNALENDELMLKVNEFIAAGTKLAGVKYIKETLDIGLLLAKGIMDARCGNPM